MRLDIFMYRCIHILDIRVYFVQGIIVGSLNKFAHSLDFYRNRHELTNISYRGQ